MNFVLPMKTGKTFIQDLVLGYYRKEIVSKKAKTSVLAFFVFGLLSKQIGVEYASLISIVKH